MSIMIKESDELNLISCQKCGAIVLTIGGKMRVFIPSIYFECISCEGKGVFDKVFGDTTQDILDT